jgi:peptide/nickel transport system ATP-binding protein/oligopeptide transport system ATP-binding protein
MSGGAAKVVLDVAGLVTSFPRAARGAPRGARTAVVEDVSLRVARGEVLALVGESGCGKTMTALSVLRLVPKPGRVDRGSVRIAGNEVTTLPIPQLRRVRGRDAAMIFQEPMTSLSPVATVGDQVIEAIRLHEPVSRAEARARTVALFEEVGIPDAPSRVDAYPHQLSGGMKQRAMIAMALSTQPKLLIADEPTTALDVTIQAQILALLGELRAQRGMAVLLITHDLGIVNEIADRVAVMYAGRVVETGTREEILSAPRHPYTQGLLASMPARAVRGTRLTEIPGNVPGAGGWPPGCRFAPRCARAFEPCPLREPETTRLSPTHTAACHAVAREEGAR